MTSATETQAPRGSCDSVAEASRATVVTVMPMSCSRVGLFLVAGLTALVLLGAAGRVTTDAGPGGWVLHAQPVEVGPTTLDQPAVIVDAEWSAAKPVAKYRDVIIAVATRLFAMPVIGVGGTIVALATVTPGRSWRAARRGRSPPRHQRLAI